MVTICATVLALPLLLLTTTNVYSEELHQSDAGLTVAMHAVGQALENVSNYCTVQVLRLQEQTIAAITKLQSVPRTVVALTQEIEVLKNKQETSDKKEETLAEFLREMTNQLQNKDLKIQDQDAKLREYQQQVQQLESTLQQLNNNTVKNKNRTKECLQPYLKEMKNMVEQFNTDGDWDQLRSGLENVVDHSSVEYRQLDGIYYHESYKMYNIGRKGYTQLASLLLCAGMNVDRDDFDGDTMLHGAAISEHLEMVKMLLDHGADVNKKDIQGATPLLRAVQDNVDMELVKMLVQGGTNTALNNNYGRTALDVATEKNHTDIIEYLKQFPH